MDVSHSLSYTIPQRISPTPNSSCFSELAEDVLSSTGTERRMNICCFISNRLNGILLHICKYIPEGKACCLLYLGRGDLLTMFQWCLNLQILPWGGWDSGFHWQPGSRREPSVSSGIYFQILSLSLSVVLFFSCFFLQLFWPTFLYVLLHYAFCWCLFSYLLCQDRYDCGSPTPFNSPA